jgi:16S rRNA (cytidine1402-2'-O)-methyltransferase
MNVKGKLYLIPCAIAEGTSPNVIPSVVRESIGHVRYFVVEDVRAARRFLKGMGLTPEELDLHVLNKDTTDADASALCRPLLEGKDVGVISEAGSPGIADPGALAVRFAHQNGVRVVPLVGPSSLLLALMASGLNGQQFAFHGYLPRDQKDAANRVKELERESRQKRQTQIFIETPHRNNSLFEVFVRTLHPDTQLTIAIDLTGTQEYIKTLSAKQWSGEKSAWPKLPAVFLFLAT